MLIQNLLEQARVPLVSVTGRTKTLTSYVEKAVSKKEGKRRYKNPAKEIVDVCGLRVVTYFDSTTKKVDALIRNEFDVDESLDKTKRTRRRTRQTESSSRRGSRGGGGEKCSRTGRGGAVSGEVIQWRR